MVVDRHVLRCAGCERRFDDMEAFDLHQPCPSGVDAVQVFTTYRFEPPMVVDL